MSEEIGKKIKALREQHGLTLEELGNKVGVGKSTVRKWETGMIANMKRDKVAALAKALGVSVEYLLGIEEQKTYSNPPTFKLLAGLRGRVANSWHING